jgi:hypothetical protein
MNLWKPDPSGHVPLCLPQNGATWKSVPAFATETEEPTWDQVFSNGILKQIYSF